MSDVYIIGVGMTPFGKLTHMTVKDLTRAASDAALADAGIARDAIGAAFFGNAGQAALEGQFMVPGEIALRAAGYGVTRLEATGRDGPVEVALLVVPRRAMNHLREVVLRVAPEAFVTIERADRPLGGVMKAAGQGRRSVVDYIRPMLDQK